MRNVTVVIHNVVVSGTLDRSLDLDALAAKLGDVQYEPESFPCVVARFRSPKCTIQAFGSGKIISTGAASTKAAADGVHVMLERMRACGVDVGDDPPVGVRNVVATADVRRHISIVGAAPLLHRSLYDPEIFSGIVHHMPHPKAVLLIFRSGKIVCVGARSEADARLAVRRVHHTLAEAGLLRPR